jgi:hypothetical protein
MALDRSDRSLENARSEALTKLDAIQRGEGGFESWLAAAVAQYAEWLERCDLAAQAGVRR